MANDNNSDDTCPCGSGRAFAQCCGPYLAGDKLPETAEALMRSRYTAFVYRDETYLLETWHPSTRPAKDLRLTDDAKWLGLKITGTHCGGAGDNTGAVQFIARYKIGGKAHRLQENSRFIREQGQWFYLDGTSPVS